MQGADAQSLRFCLSVHANGVTVSTCFKVLHCFQIVFKWCCFRFVFHRFALQVPELARAQVWQETTAQKWKSEEIDRD
jgi:hypothetical protein